MRLRSGFWMCGKLIFHRFGAEEEKPLTSRYSNVTGIYLASFLWIQILEFYWIFPQTEKILLWWSSQNSTTLGWIPQKSGDDCERLWQKKGLFESVQSRKFCTMFFNIGVICREHAFHPGKKMWKVVSKQKSSHSIIIFWSRGSNKRNRESNRMEIYGGCRELKWLLCGWFCEGVFKRK